MSAEITLYIEGQSPRTMAAGTAFSIGRAPTNDLVLNESKVSRNHAMIRLQGDKLYYVLDLGSSNGTILNGRRVSIPCALKSGDEITIAGHRMIFNHHVVETPPAEQPATEDLRTQVEFTSATVSILVVDIRNFTPLSESLPPEYLSKMIGEWFKEVQGIIERNGGTINKFIGDAVMCYWTKTRTEGNPLYIMGALQSAVEMVDLAKAFHQRLSSDHPKYSFHIGCGINAGKAIMGNVGVDSLPDFTAVGDCVNVAFRVESLCKELQRPIIVTEEVAHIAVQTGDKFNFDDLGLHKLKGKTQEQRVFAIKI
jgi:adenylate cyclase